MDQYSSDGVLEHNRRVQVLEGMSENESVWMLGLLFPVEHWLQALLTCTAKLVVSPTRKNKWGK